MKLDHIAYRVNDRHNAAAFLKKTLNYNISTEFEIIFDNKSTAKCLVLHLESESGITSYWTPEIFISDGTEHSIVREWVKERNGGGVHHLAYQVNNIQKIVDEWKKNGVEFLTDNVINCPEDNMKQIFSKPVEQLGGVIIELIEREDKGFCQNSVKDLMNSTKGA